MPVHVFLKSLKLCFMDDQQANYGDHQESQKEYVDKKYIDGLLRWIEGLEKENAELKAQIAELKPLAEKGKEYEEKRGDPRFLRNEADVLLVEEHKRNIEKR